MSGRIQPHSRVEVGRRLRSRVRLHLPARIMFVSGTSNCTLVDLSQSGARVFMHACPAVGDFGMLRCQELDAYFTVMWTMGSLCGLQFDELQPERTLLGLRWLADNFAKLEKRELERTTKEWVSGRVSAIPVA